MNLPLLEQTLFGPEAGAVFSGERLLQHMLDFEAALAQAQAECGLLPATAAEAITRCCRAADFDPQALAGAGAPAGSLVIPLVRALTQAVETIDPAAGAWVHFGGTSQDVLDTAMVLATGEALALLDSGLAALADALLHLAEGHVDTPVLARTLLQPAQVTSFGLKCALWAAPLCRARLRLRRQAERGLQLQLGGAIGTLASMGPYAEAVRSGVARRLRLEASASSWHTQRDEWVHLGLEAAVLTGSLGKIATDLALMSQGEVAELAEAPAAGRGASSAMPHKRNPVAAMVALAAAKRAPARAGVLLACMDQQHERGLGNWQAELAEWPGLWTAAHGAVQALGQAFAGLVVDAPRMLGHIEALRGLVFAESAARLFAPALGRNGAHAFVQSLSRRCVDEQLPLAGICQQALAQNPALAAQVSAEALRQVFSIDQALRPAARLARRQIADCRAALQDLEAAHGQ